MEIASQETGLIDYLGSFVSESRRRKIEEVLDLRTRHLTIVLEDIYQRHNASAVLRSCECFGIQDVYALERRNRFDVNTDIALGAGHWLDLKRRQLGEEESLVPVYSELRSAGYRIVASAPVEHATALDELEVGSRVAIVLGTEEGGLSSEALELADETVRIPMFGFTRSFNVSVSAALILSELTGRIRASAASWRLAPVERQTLRLAWYRQSVRGSEELERRYLQDSNQVTE